jgi:hypothetical protein
MLANLRRVVPTSLTVAVVKKATELIDLKLMSQAVDDANRHVRKVLQKGAQEASRAELNGKAETIVVATVGVDQLPVAVIQVEVPVQLFRGGFSVEVAVTISLLFGQETDGQGPPPIRGRHLQNLQVLQGNRDCRISAESYLQKYPAKGSFNARTFARQRKVRH